MLAQFDRRDLELYGNLLTKQHHEILTILCAQSQRDAAFYLHIPVGTVKSRSHRAVASLKLIKQRETNNRISA